MSKKILIDLQVRDNLTPEIKKSKEEIESLYNEVEILENKLKLLKGDKRHIVSGNVESDIKDIRKLQIELKKLQEVKKRDGSINKKKAEIERLVRIEIEKQTMAIKRKKEEIALNTAKLKKSTIELNKNEQAQQRATSSLKKDNAVRRSAGTMIVRHIKQVESMIVALYGLSRAYSGTVGRGVELHRQIESQTAGIAALISANTQLVNSGDIYDNFNEAMKISSETVKKLKTASIETAATFPELTSVFQQAIGGALGASAAMGGATQEVIDNTIQIAQRMTNIAGAIGMPMVQVNEEIRSIIEGTIDVNSRIAKMLGLTNEQIRNAKVEANGLVKLLNTELGKFDPIKKIQTFDRVIARVKDAWDTIVLQGTDKFFVQYKDKMLKLYKYLQDNSERLSKQMANFLGEAVNYGEKLFSVLSSVFGVIRDNRNLLEMFFKGWLIFKVGKGVVGGLKSIKKIIKGIETSTATISSIVGGGAMVTSLGKMEKSFGRVGSKIAKVVTLVGSLRLGLAGVLAGLGAILVTSVSKVVDTWDWKSQKQQLAEYRQEQEALLQVRKQLKKEEQQKTYEATYKGGAEKKLNILKNALKQIEKAFNEGKISVGSYENSVAQLNIQISKLDSMLGNINASKKLSEALPKELLEDIAKYTEDYTIGVGWIDDYSKKVRTLKADIANIEKAQIKVFQSNDDTALQQIDMLLAKKHDELLQLQKKHNKKIAQENKTAYNKRIKQQEELSSKREAIEKQYYQNIGDKAKLFYLEEQELIEKLTEAKIKDIDKYVNAWKEAKREQEQAEQESFLLGVYEELENKTKAWKIKQKRLEEAFAKYKIGMDSKIAQEYVKKQKEAYFAVEKKAKKSFNEVASYWDKITSSMGQSIEDNFFNYFKNGFKDLKGMFKNLGKDILANFTNPLYRKLSASIAGMVVPTYAGDGNTVSSIAKSAGLSLVNGQWQGGGETSGVPNIIMDATGNVVKGGDLLGGETMSMLSNLSSGSSVLSFLSNPMDKISQLGNFVSNPIGAFNYYATAGRNLINGAFTDAGYFLSENLGLGGLGGVISNFGSGFSSTLTGGAGIYNAGFATGAGSLLGAGALGYGVGSLGDILFNADTKAGTFGAIGAGIGSVVPVIGTIAGGLLGSVIGGLFGKWKVKDKGIKVYDEIFKDTILDEKVMATYTLKKKKSWFGSKKKTSYKPLEDEQYRQIEGQIKNISSLLESVGSLREFSISAGQYSKNEFSEVAIPKAIISSIMDIPQTISKIVEKSWFGVKALKLEKLVPNPKLDEVYKIWEDYAKSIDKSVFEAMSESLQSMVQTRRSFTEWLLKDNNVELASFKANTLKKDAESIAKGLGVDFAKLTADNFLEKYNEAISNTFSPTIINQWNSLANAFKQASDAQKEYTNAVIQTTQNQHNALIAFAQSTGKDVLSVQLQAAKHTLYNWVLANGTKNLGTIKRIGMEEAVSRWVSWAKSKTLEEMNAYMQGNALKPEFIKYITSVINLQKAIEDASSNHASGYTYTPTYNTPLTQYDYYDKYTPQNKLIEEAKKAVGLAGELTRDALNERYKFFDGKSATSETISKMNEAFSRLEGALKSNIDTLDTLKEKLDAIGITISSLKSIYDTSKGVIDKLYGNNSKYVENQYETYLKQARLYQEKVKDNIYDSKSATKLQEAVSFLSGYVDDYLHESNFDNKFDYEFRKSVVANQFTEFKDTASVHDLLKEVVDEIKELKKETKDQAPLQELEVKLVRRISDVLERKERGELDSLKKVAI